MSEVVPIVEASNIIANAILRAARAVGLAYLIGKIIQAVFNK